MKDLVLASSFDQCPLAWRNFVNTLARPYGEAWMQVGPDIITQELTNFNAWREVRSAANMFEPSLLHFDTEQDLMMFLLRYS